MHTTFYASIMAHTFNYDLSRMREHSAHRDYQTSLYINSTEIDTSGDADHFELLYKNVGHYDSIMALSGGLSTVSDFI